MCELRFYVALLVVVMSLFVNSLFFSEEFNWEKGGKFYSAIFLKKVVFLEFRRIFAGGGFCLFSWLLLDVAV